MNTPNNIDISLLPIRPRGSKENHNTNLCWQSHDDYYKCIDEQVTTNPSQGKLLI
jgi:hypothetical protein